MFPTHPRQQPSRVESTRVGPFVVAPGCHPRLCEQVTTASRECATAHLPIFTGTTAAALAALLLRPHSQSEGLTNVRRGTTPACLRTFPDS